MSSPASSARDGALAKLAAEAARFAAPPATPPGPAAPAAARPVTLVSRSPRPGRLAPPGYVPVAVAPERGNTRPVVPVDGRIHMRMAQATINAVDEIVVAWRGDDPVALRDLERATMVRIGIAMLLADVAQNGTRGAVGEAVRAALDPTVRHTDQPLPSLNRWLRPTPVRPASDADPNGDPGGDAGSG